MAANHDSRLSLVLVGEAEQTEEVRRVTWVGLVVNLCLAGCKFAGGFWGGSQAVIADAVHSLSDMSTDMAILLGVRYWTKPADLDHPHGHRRLETMVTLSIGLLLGVVATGLLWNALSTLSTEHETAPRWVAFWAALLSILCKEVLYRWTLRVGRSIKSMPVVANAWHHRSDAFSSIPVAVAVAVAAVDPRWGFLDHVAAVAVSLFIYQASFRIIRPAFHKLIDAGASEKELQDICNIARATAGVEHVHGVRTRYVSCSNLAVDLHIEVAGDMSVRKGHDISEEVKRRILNQGPDVIDVVVHLEPHG
jgi:cation diffusion facilitator family transporter